MNKIEIDIPAGASEVTLKTAGKYCNKDIRVKSHFRIESGTNCTIKDEKTDGAQMLITLSEKPKILFIKANQATAKKIVEYVEGRTISSEQTKNYSFGAIINMAHDMVVAGYGAENETNSVLFNYQWYNLSGTPIAAQALKALGAGFLKYTEGTLSFLMSNAFDTFDDGTKAEYEWTAYYWNEETE